MSTRQGHYFRVSMKKWFCNFCFSFSDPTKMGGLSMLLLAGEHALTNREVGHCWRPPLDVYASALRRWLTPPISTPWGSVTCTSKKILTSRHSGADCKGCDWLTFSTLFPVSSLSCFSLLPNCIFKVLVPEPFTPTNENYGAIWVKLNICNKINCCSLSIMSSSNNTLCLISHHF